MTSSSRTQALFLLAATLGGASALFALTSSAGPRTSTSSLAAPATPPLPASTGGGSVRVSAALAHPVLLEEVAGETFLRLEVVARELEEPGRRPVSIALVIDHSGSMTGAKLDDAKRAAKSLVDQLGPRDRIAVVAYSDLARLVSPLSRVTAADRARIHEQIDSVQPEASTNLEAGMRLGAEAVLGEADPEVAVRRVFLLSDGLANVGLQGADALGMLAASFLPLGVSATTVGLGVDFDDVTMESIAQRAAGHYYFQRDSAELPALFGRELGRAGATVATGVEVLVQLGEGVELTEAFGYRIERQGRDVVIPLPDLSSGAAWQIMSRLQFRGLRGRRPIAEVRVRYTDVQRDRAREVGSAGVVFAETTGSPQQVQANENREVLMQSTRLAGAVAMRQAAELFEQGRGEEAARVLDASASSARDAFKRFGSKLLAELSSELARSAGDARTLQRDAADGKGFAKSRKRSLGDFNEMNTGR